MRSPRRLPLALAAGALVALSLPSWGWWPLAYLGLGGLTALTAGLPPGARWWTGVAFGVGMFVPGLWWMGEFHIVGAALVVVLETAFVAAAVAATPTPLALPAALVLAEAARSTVPFGGLPMAGVPLGQVAGPLAPAARVGGELLLLALAAVLGVALADAAVHRRLLRSAATLAVVVLVAVLSAVAPDGGPPVDRLDVAAVQGGGRRGFRAVDSDPSAVFDAHLAASARVRTPVDLVLWPEDVVDVTDRITEVPEGDALAALADRLDATLVAGVVEDIDGDKFANAAVAWDGDGTLADRYDKAHRVPFGEYVPGRGLIEKVADLSAIPRDAIPGTGPGVLRTPAGDLGTVISFEVFFADRARAAVEAGGRLLLVPTNAASYSTSQVPTTEVAAARLRAIENGRDVVQAAPTGYTVIIDHLGRVRQRSTLGARQVLHAVVPLRTGRTLYARGGDAPVVVVALLVLLAAWRRVKRVT